MHTSFYFTVNIRLIISYSELQMMSESIKQRCLVSLHTHQNVKHKRECGRQFILLCRLQTLSILCLLHYYTWKCAVNSGFFSISNLFRLYADLDERALSGVFFLCDLRIFLVNMARSFVFFSFVVVCIGYKGNCRKGSALVFWDWWSCQSH